MKEAVRQTRSYLIELFQRQGFYPRTDLGQNFLIDLNLVEYIVNQAQLGLQDVVLEVGAGTAGLTTFLAQQAAIVVSVEVDRSMFRLAHEAVSGLDNVTLLNCDVLKNKNHLSPKVLDPVQKSLEQVPGRRLKLISNLPYNVATPVISNLLAQDLSWERMIVTIQWELAQKLAARPGTPHYGALSAWIQAQCRPRILKRLPPTVFWPRPKVHSAIVRLQPDARRRKRIADRPFFHDFIRRLFHQRRKLLRGVCLSMYRKQLSKQDVDSVLAQLDLTEPIRAEQLEVDRLVELSNRFHSTVTRTSRSQE